MCRQIVTKKAVCSSESLGTGIEQEYFLVGFAEKAKALVYAGVPSELSKKLSAGDWVKAALEVLGGKGGGKPTTAQGQGPLVEKLPEAIKAAAAYADSKF